MAPPAAGAGGTGSPPPDDGQGAMLGTPLPGCVLHLLDDAWQPLVRPTPPVAGDDAPADAEVGQIAIGGVQLGRGYLHQPALTAQRFVEVAARARACACTPCMCIRACACARARASGCIRSHVLARALHVHVRRWPRSAASVST